MTYFMSFYWTHFLSARPNKGLFTNDLLVANVKNFGICFFPQTKNQNVMFVWNYATSRRGRCVRDGQAWMRLLPPRERSLSPTCATSRPAPPPPPPWAPDPDKKLTFQKELSESRCLWLTEWRETRLCYTLALRKWKHSHVLPSFAFPKKKWMIICLVWIYKQSRRN